MGAVSYRGVDDVAVSAGEAGDGGVRVSLFGAFVLVMGLGCGVAGGNDPCGVNVFVLGFLLPVLEWCSPRLGE